MHLACLEENQDIVSIWIEKNADPSPKDHTGKIPLQYALRSRRRDIVNILLNAPPTKLKSVRLNEWFILAGNKPCCIKLTKNIGGRGFDPDLVNDLESVWPPNAKGSTLW